MNRKIIFLTITNILLVLFVTLSYFMKNNWQEPLIVLSYLMCGFTFISGIFANFTPSKYASFTMLLSVIATGFLTYINFVGVL